MAKRSVEDTDIRTARKQQSRKKRIRQLIIAFVLLGIAFCIYALRGLWVPKLEGFFEKPHGLIVNDGKLASGNFPLELSDNGTTRLYTIDDMFASVDDSSVKLYNIGGELQNTIQRIVNEGSGGLICILL